ncbi:MAG: Appr-1-p processing protein [Myxococcales bacterium]|nr:Appr-1-p processing protein [Myxococcales bacterium]
MVGACIGAQLGYEALPKVWCETLQHRDTLLRLADRLATPQKSGVLRGELIDVTGDIAERHVDAIVNAWNRNIIPPWLLIPQGVSRAIRQRGGRRAIVEVGRKGPLPLGASVETLGGDVAATWIVHADAIDLAWRSSESSIRDATRSALRLAQWLGARTVAVPVLGAGSGGYAREEALEMVREECEKSLASFDCIELVRGP